MSHFRELLRQSKLATLPSAGARVASKDVPQQQVLRTTSASHHRRNWGIKGPLPQKAKSTLISFDKLENERGFPEVDYGAESTRRLQKFRELGAHVDLHKGTELSSLTEAGPQRPRSLATLSIKERKRLIREAAARRLEYHQTAPAAGDGDRKSALFSRAQEFMGLAPLPHGSAQAARSAIGLSYATKGVLHNTPQGLVKSHVVAGRVLPRKSNQRVAVAGFIGRIPSRVAAAQGAISNEKAVPLLVDTVTADPQGGVNMSLYASDEASKSSSDDFQDHLSKLGL